MRALRVIIANKPFGLLDRSRDRMQGSRELLWQDWNHADQKRIPVIYTLKDFPGEVERNY